MKYTNANLDLYSAFGVDPKTKSIQVANVPMGTSTDIKLLVRFFCTDEKLVNLEEKAKELGYLSGPVNKDGRAKYWYNIVSMHKL